MKLYNKSLIVIILILLRTQIYYPQWVQTNGPNAGLVSCLAVSGSNIFAGIGVGGVYHSTNNGTNWIQTNNGLTNMEVWSLVVGENYIFAGTVDGVYRSKDNGTNWTHVFVFSSYNVVWSLAVSGNNIFAGTNNGGVYRSTNNGTNWTQINNGLTSKDVWSLIVKETNIYAGTDDGVFLSTNNGANWIQVNNELKGSIINTIPSNGKSIISNSTINLKSSMNERTNWERLYLTNYDVPNSKNAGTNLEQLSNGLTNITVRSLAVSGTNIFAGTFGYGAYLSTNNGTNWTQVNNGLTNLIVRTLAVNGARIFACTDGGVFVSTDNGTNWTSAGLINAQYVFSIAIIQSNIFAGTDDGVYSSTDYGTNWTQVNNGLTVTSVDNLATSGTNVFANSNYGLYFSRDYGTNWTQVNNGLTNTEVNTFVVSGPNIFAGTFGNGVYLSTNNGTNWTQVNDGLTSTDVRSFAVSGTNIYAGTTRFNRSDGGVYLSTNNGTNWTQVNNNLTNFNINALAISGTNVFAGTSGGVFLSTNNGANWAWVYDGLTSSYINTLAICGTSVFAATNGGVFISTNKGTNWVQANNGLPNSVNAFAINGTNIFASLNGDGVYLSTDNGINWSQVNTGLTNTYIRSLTISGNNIYAGSDGAGVWRRPLSEFALVQPSISITYPNGSEVWEGNSIHNITWLEENNLSNIKIDLSTDGGNNWIGLITVPPGKGTYNWTVPPFVCTKTKVRVSLFDFPQYTSQSVQNFTITTNSTPAVYVTSPNGGDIFKAGNIQNITWTTSPSILDLKIDLTTDKGATWNPIANSVPASIGAFSWTIPNTTSTSCKIRLTDASVSTVYDVSDSVFVIKTMSVTSPNGGEVWKSGSIKDITFTTGVAYVDIKYSTDNGGSWNDIINNFSSISGTYSWTVTSISSTQYLIKISDTNDSTFYDISDNPFIIWQVVVISQNPIVNRNHLNFGPTNILLDLWIFIPSQITTTFYEYETPQTGNLPPGVNNVSQYYWTISAPGISFLNGYFNVPISTLRGINNSANLVWLKRTNPGDAWTNIGGSLTDGNLVNTTAFTSFSEFAIGTTGDDPLPVQLANFLAKQDKGNVFLNWETKTEIQNAGFDIERKTEKDKQFTKIGFIKGSGNSNTPTQYKYSDNTVQGGKIFYRLGQINNDGKVTYSKEIEVNVIPSEYSLNQNYPNPFNPSTKISYKLKDKGVVKLNVYDIRGELLKVLVNETKDAGYYETEFDGKGLASGVYIYRIEVIGNGNRPIYSDIKKTVLLK